MTKGEKTKQRIVNSARELFAQKGYFAVTMKDICIAAGISRGGLYAHFSSTSDIMQRIIEQEQKDAIDAFLSAKARGISAYNIISGFLNKRANELSNKDISITGAINEFARSGEKELATVSKRASDAVDILSEMIKLGQQEGTLRETDPRRYACSMLWLIEGMNSHAQIIGMDSETAFKHLLFVLDMLKK